MPADYRLLKDLGVAYVRFGGHVTMDEVMACFTAFAQEDRDQSILRHLIDFSGVTSFDGNFVQIIETQAQMASVFTKDRAQLTFAYYAPTPKSREMAAYGVRAWNDVPNVVLRVTETEGDAMGVFGFSQQTFEELLAHVTPI